MDDLSNKTIVIGINFFDSENNLLEQYQTSGTIKSTENGFLVIERENEPDFQLPNDEQAMKTAPLGLYKEKATGKEIENPDFIAQWRVDDSSIESMENSKMRGFERE